jgi:hypothetical protein
MELFGMRVIVSDAIPADKIAIVGTTCRYCHERIAPLARCRESLFGNNPFTTCQPEMAVIDNLEPAK